MTWPSFVSIRRVGKASRTRVLVVTAGTAIVCFMLYIPVGTPVPRPTVIVIAICVWLILELGLLARTAFKATLRRWRGRPVDLPPRQKISTIGRPTRSHRPERSPKPD